jgi:hypothetical protein
MTIPQLTLAALEKKEQGWGCKKPNGQSLTPSPRQFFLSQDSNLTTGLALTVALTPTGWLQCPGSLGGSKWAAKGLRKGHE